MLYFAVPFSKLRAMKKLLFLGFLLIQSIAGGIEKGAPRTAVIAELGQPEGSMRRDGKEILLFKTGTVTLQGGVVIATDLSQKYAQEDAERALKAKEIRAAELQELAKQKLIHPEDSIVRTECVYDKTENWETLPESIRPAQGRYGYDVYIPLGYHESTDRAYKCLFLESSALWDGVKERARNEKWIVVILPDASGQQIGQTMNGNFLAAYDDVTKQFRVAREYRFIAGKIPAAIFASMRPVAGIILRDPDFSGMQKNNISLDFLRQNQNLRVYLLLSNRDRDNTLFQAQFIVDRIPKYYVEVYEDGTGIQPKALADRALDWMEKEYGLL